MYNNDARLLVISQTVNTQFAKWLRQFSVTHRPVEFWCGHKILYDETSLFVRYFPPYRRTSAISRLFTWIHFAVDVFFKLLRTRRDTPVFATSNPPFLPLVVWLIYKLRGQPYGLLEWDIYPQILQAMSIATTNNIIYKLW